MITSMPTHASVAANNHNDVRPLSSIRSGESVQLAYIDAGRRLTRRLTELGLTPGVTIQVIHVNGGPMLIAVRGARLAIGKGMAEKILVSVPQKNLAKKLDDASLA